ncbi:MAG: hypothetical protein ABIH26_11260 [Candidatus Eisenbacteria bacterium]
MKALLRPLLMGAILAAFFAGAASAEIPGIVWDWAPESYGWEPGYANHMSQPGAVLTIVGKIDRFFDPFLDLDPDAVEYTFIFRDVISLGSMDLGGIILTNYAGGFFEVYEDPTNNADFGVNPPNLVSPATFTDGTLVLNGFLANFYVQQFQGPGGWSGTYTVDIEFTGPVGGELYDRVEQCYGTSGGGWSDSAPIIPLGYTVQVDGHMNIEDCHSTGTETSTWGSVKQMFK